LINKPDPQKIGASPLRLASREAAMQNYHGFATMLLVVKIKSCERSGNTRLVVTCDPWKSSTA
jgi:hypothetical protein